VVRLVADELRAWRAGRSVWRGRRGVNDLSLGWELANRNDGREPYSDAQHTAVAALAVHYIRQGLEPSAVVSHAEVALPAGRKVDPLGFDWRRFRRDTELLLTLLP
jgi:N-acetylmuramoyl-L-alanine amidase/AmpD protein